MGFFFLGEILLRCEPQKSMVLELIIPVLLGILFSFFLNVMSVLNWIPLKYVVCLKCFCKSQNQWECVGTFRPERQKTRMSVTNLSCV